METMLSRTAVSVTQLKRHYATILLAAQAASSDADDGIDGAVAILNHHRPEAYLVPAAYYEKLVRTQTKPVRQALSAKPSIAQAIAAIRARIGYKGPAISIDEMNAAVLREAKRRHPRKAAQKSA